MTKDIFICLYNYSYSKDCMLINCCLNVANEKFSMFPFVKHRARKISDVKDNGVGV